MNTVGGRLSTCDSKVLLWSHRREIHLLPHDPLPRDHSATALLRADRVRICRNFRVTLELPCHGSGRGGEEAGAQDERDDSRPHRIRPAGSRRVVPAALNLQRMASSRACALLDKLEKQCYGTQNRPTKSGVISVKPVGMAANENYFFLEF